VKLFVRCTMYVCVHAADKSAALYEIRAGVGGEGGQTQLQPIRLPAGCARHVRVTMFKTTVLRTGVCTAAIAMPVRDTTGWTDWAISVECKLARGAQLFS